MRASIANLVGQSPSQTLQLSRYEIYRDLETGLDYVWVNGVLYEVLWTDRGIVLREADDKLGFLFSLISTGLGIGKAIKGSREAKRLQETMRDSRKDDAIAQIQDIKNAVLNCNMDPDQAVRAARGVVSDYYAWADQALTVASVRKSAENFRNQPGGFNEQVKSVSEAAEKVRRRCSRAGTSSSVIDSASGALSTKVGGIPLWALGLGALALLSLSR